MSLALAPHVNMQPKFMLPAGSWHLQASVLHSLRVAADAARQWLGVDAAQLQAPATEPASQVLQVRHGIPMALLAACCLCRPWQ